MILLTVTVTLLFVMRLMTPADLEGYAQPRSIGYVIDAIERGNWWLPLDLDGQVTSKPPLHTWLAGGISWLLGDVNRLTLTLPSFLAILGTAWVIFLGSRRYLGAWPACYGALMFVLSPLAIKHMALIRADAVFTFIVALASWLAFRAWREGRSWTPFWIAVTFSIFAKGPLGLVLAGGGLVVARWERHRVQDSVRRARHWPGVMFLLVAMIGWALLAWRAQGYAVVEKMVFDELLGHAAGAGRSTLPGTQAWKPFLYFLSRFVPWSVLTVWAVWHVWRQPPTDALERAWTRYLISAMVVGLVIFSLAANHRADHLLPLFPAAAALAGRQLHLLAQSWDAKKLRAIGITAAAILIVGLVAYYGSLPSRRAEVASQTRDMQELAAALLDRFDDQAMSIVPVDTPSTLGLYLRNYHRKVPMNEAVDRLKQDRSQLIMVRDVDALHNHLEKRAIAVHTVLEWPVEEDRETEIYVITGSDDMEES